jgi:hypothetical protein
VVDWSDNDILRAAHKLRVAGDVAGLLHLSIAVQMATSRYTGRIILQRDVFAEGPFTIPGGDAK